MVGFIILMFISLALLTISVLAILQKPDIEMFVCICLSLSAIVMLVIYEVINAQQTIPTIF